MEIRDTISTFPTLPLRRCLTPLRVCETDQCVCERSKPALLKSVWKCELLEFDCLCRLAMRGLHYGQELASTNRPDTFAQTIPPTTTILLAIWRRTIQFPWPALRAANDAHSADPARARSPSTPSRRSMALTDIAATERNLPDSPEDAHRTHCWLTSALAIYHPPRFRPT